MKASRYCAVLAALVLTGCTSVVTGAASVDKAELKQYQDDHAPLTAQRALGDLTTVDYCSMLDVGAVEQGGTITTGDPLSTFNYCTVSGTLTGQQVDVSVGYLASDDAPARHVPDTSRKLERGLTVLKDTSDDSYSCERFLKFTDGLVLEVYVSSSDSSTDVSSSAMCETADSTVYAAADAVEGKKITHQTFAAGSLGTLDACSLVSDAEVAAQVPGARKSPRIPTEHRCRWTSGSESTTAMAVYFDISQPYPGTTEQLAGRATTISPPGSTFCIASTTIGPAPGAKNGEVQLAQVYSFGGASADACGPVRAIAGLVWPKLPAA